MKILYILPFILFISIGAVFSQVDVSPLLASKLKAKNFNEFGYHLTVTKVDKSECFVGDCNNGYGIKYAVASVKYKNNGTTYFDSRYFFVFGDFVNGKLSGKGGLICGSDRVTWFSRKLQHIKSGAEFDKVNLSCKDDNEQVLFGEMSRENYEVIFGDFKDNIVTEGYYINYDVSPEEGALYKQVLPFKNVVDSHAIQDNRAVYDEYLFRYKGPLSLKSKEGLILDKKKFEAISHSYANTYNLTWFYNFKKEFGQICELTIIPTDTAKKFDVAEIRFKKTKKFGVSQDTNMVYQIKIDENEDCVSCPFDKKLPPKPYVKEYGNKKDNPIKPGTIVHYEHSYGTGSSYGYVNEILGNKCISVTDFPLKKNQFKKWNYSRGPEIHENGTGNPYKAEQTYNSVYFYPSEACGSIVPVDLWICNNCNGYGSWGEKYFQQGAAYNYDVVDYKKVMEGGSYTMKTTTTKVGHYAGRTRFRKKVCPTCGGFGLVK